MKKLHSCLHITRVSNLPYIIIFSFFFQFLKVTRCSNSFPTLFPISSKFKLFFSSQFNLETCITSYCLGFAYFLFSLYGRELLLSKGCSAFYVLQKFNCNFVLVCWTSSIAKDEQVKSEDDVDFHFEYHFFICIKGILDLLVC